MKMFEVDKEKKQISYPNFIPDYIKNVTLNISAKDLAKIPSDGAFISFSNRPIGIIEELVLAQLFSYKREDYNFLNNKFLENETSFYKNYLEQNTLLDVYGLLSNNNAIGLFPVGNISSFQNEMSAFTDSKWDKVIVKQLYKTEAPIIPIYFNVENNNIFKILGTIPHQHLNYESIKNIVESKGLEISILVGKPIVKNKFNFNNSNHFGQFIRAKLYGLSSKLKVDIFYSNKPPKEIAEAIDPEKIANELNAITDTNLIGEQGDFQVFIVKAKKIPYTIQEIGRLRECTFRNVGEGTNEHIDLDEYDLHYLHLFLFDKVNKKIAGAYRIGDGKYIMKTIGKKGFYLSSLFKIKKGFYDILNQCIELGRSFVVPEYQNKRLPLFMLWKGILYYLRSNNYLKYMLGPVSISSTYSKTSQGLMVKYIMKYHWDKKLAKEIQPKMAFKSKFDDIDYNVLVDCSNNQLKLLDNIIEDIDPYHNKVPVLLKKYFAQNAKVIGFNVDPLFNDALDGFMLTDIEDLPEENFDTFNLNKKIDYAH